MSVVMQPGKVSRHGNPIEYDALAQLSEKHAPAAINGAVKAAPLGGTEGLGGLHGRLPLPEFKNADVVPASANYGVARLQELQNEPNGNLPWLDSGNSRKDHTLLLLDGLTSVSTGGFGAVGMLGFKGLAKWLASLGKTAIPKIRSAHPINETTHDLFELLDSATPHTARKTVDDLRYRKSKAQEFLKALREEDGKAAHGVPMPEHLDSPDKRQSLIAKFSGRVDVADEAIDLLTRKFGIK